jgi:hypothetical protein
VHPMAHLTLDAAIGSTNPILLEAMGRHCLPICDSLYDISQYNDTIYSITRLRLPNGSSVVTDNIADTWYVNWYPKGNRPIALFFTGSV